MGRKKVFGGIFDVLQDRTEKNRESLDQKTSWTTSEMTLYWSLAVWRRAWGVCVGGICTFLRMCDHISEHVIDSVRGRQSYRNPRGKKWEHAPRQFIKENKNLWPLTFNIQTYLILQPAWHLHILQEWFQTSELKGQFEAFFWYTHDFKSNILKQVKMRWNSSLCLTRASFYLSASGKLVRSVYWFKTMLKCPVWSRNKKICYVTSVVYMCS